MAEPEVALIFMAKAGESLAGAESEFVNGRYNNCANRCYYACFQAAIAALAREGIAPSGSQWGHTFVQGRFVGELINRRKLYPPELRDVLERAYVLRQTADYSNTQVSPDQSARAIRRTRALVQKEQKKGKATK